MPNELKAKPFLWLYSWIQLIFTFPDVKGSALRPIADVHPSVKRLKDSRVAVEHSLLVALL